MPPLRPVCLLACGALFLMGSRPLALGYEARAAAAKTAPSAIPSDDAPGKTSTGGPRAAPLPVPTAATANVNANVTASVNALQRYDFSGPGMATTFRISCYASSRAQAEKATDACFARIAELNQIFTDYDPTSELMRLCAPGAVYPVTVSAPMMDLLTRAVDFARISDGAFDPTCGHLSQLWRRTRRQGKLPPPARLEAARAATDWRRVTLVPATRQVTLRPGTLLDLGGIAKGYAADDCLRLLREHGLPSAVVQAGGDTAVGDAPPGQRGWEVKIRTFTNPGEADALTSLWLANRAVSTSGDLYQYIELGGTRYSHILSLDTGLGLTQRIACSVIAADCTTTDALATAFCVLGQEKGTRLAATLPGVELQFALPQE